MAKDNTNLNDDLKLELLNLISLSRRRQELYIDTIIDSWILAAEQVQDKRLEVLESGPEVAIEQIIIDFCITLLLGPCATVLMKSITKSVFTKIGKTLTTYFVKEGNFWVIDKRKYIKEVTSSTLAIIRKATNETVNVSLDVTKRRLRTMAISALQGGGIPHSQKILEANDSPGVGVVSAVSSYVRHLKASINLVHDDYINKVVANGINNETAVDLIKFIKEDINYSNIKDKGDPFAGLDISIVKEEYKRHFEWFIWTLIFPEMYRLEPNYLPAEYTAMMGPSEGSWLVVPKKLLQYFIRRFIHPWSKCSETFLQYNVKRMPTASRSGIEEISISDLNKFWKEINKQAAKMKDDGFVVSQLKPKKQT